MESGGWVVEGRLGGLPTPLVNCCVQGAYVISCFVPSSSPACLTTVGCGREI